MVINLNPLLNLQHLMGVCFYDMDPLLSNYEMCNEAMTNLANQVRHLNPTIILGVESRGFSIAPYLAHFLKLGWKMCRKVGKTPGRVFTEDYSVEYGGTPRTLELKQDAFSNGDRVLIVDDVLATGGTCSALERLVERTGAVVVGSTFLLQIQGILSAKLKYPTVSLITFKLNEETTSKTTQLQKTQHKTTTTLTQVGNDSTSKNTNKIVILYYKIMKNMAQSLYNTYPYLFELKEISWDMFLDGTPNIKFPCDLENRHVVYLGSLNEKNNILEQLLLVQVLPRQGLETLSIVYPYYSFGCYERVDTEGDLASAECLAKLLSNNMPLCNRGVSNVLIYDIHALQERFYTTDDIRLKLQSAMTLLKQQIADEKHNIIIVFPDDGAFKRFHKSFEGYQTITCAKVRDGEKRFITIKDRDYNKSNNDLHCMIVDDMVNSGQTLYECMKVLKTEGFDKINAFVTHAVFALEAYLDFLPGGKKEGFYRFYTTDSVPETSSKLPAPFFQVLSLAPLLSARLLQQTGSEYVEKQKPRKIGFLLASNQLVKQEACFQALKEIYPHEEVQLIKNFRNYDSHVNPQPVGEIEIETGCNQRFKKIQEDFISNDLDYLSSYDRIHIISIENGIVLGNNDDGNYYDRACIMMSCNENREIKMGWSDVTLVPKQAFLKSEELNFQTTVGSILAFDSCISKSKFINENDWHAEYGCFNRKTLLKQTIKQLLTSSF